MPTYEYKCKSCGKVHEVDHGFHDERPTVCPTCGGPLVRVFHPVGVHFKGSGFYKTDSARPTRSASGAEKSEKTSDSPSESKPSEAKPSESKPSSSESKSKEP